MERPRRSALFTLVVSLSLLLTPGAASSQGFETKAPFATLVDADSGTVLFQKAAEEPMAPASMSKLMTVEYVFHLLKEGRVALTDEFTVTEDAWRRGGASSGGSTMFAKLNSRVPLIDLLRGVIIQSGNDASIAIAEGLSGTELNFADLLTKRGREIGLTKSTFRNSTGLPDPDQRVTARDLAVLARHIIREYPDLYPIFAERDFTWNGITQQNRNPLLNEGIGADGLKTGHTEESGYGLVGSAKSGDQRLILVVNGLKSMRERETEARKLLDWGFRSFRQITAFQEGEAVAEADVYGGVKGGVPLTARGPVRITVPRASAEALRARVVYQGPLVAPVEPGREVGLLKVWQGEKLIQETPLYTAEAVPEGGFHQKALDAAGELLLGWIP